MRILRNLKRNLKALLQSKSVVLCYHRVVELAVDPWQLAVSPKNFEEQLCVLKKYNVLKTDELVKQMQQGKMQSHSVCVSFDDGYRDNYEYAKPLLEKHSIPATFFIASGFLGKRQMFWWDELEYLFLGPHSLPNNISFNLDQTAFNYDLEGNGSFSPSQYEKHKSWVWIDKPPTTRCQVYLDVWKILKPLPLDKIDNCIQQLKSQVSFLSANNNHFPMTMHEFNCMVSVKEFTIGVHTVTHPALASHNIAYQTKEILNCRTMLEEICNRPVTLIAYPYGIYNASTIEVVRNLKMSGGFTTSERTVLPEGDIFQLGRFQVKNWDGEQFERQLHTWAKQF